MNCVELDGYDLNLISVLLKTTKNKLSAIDNSIFNFYKIDYPSDVSTELDSGHSNLTIESEGNPGIVWRLFQHRNGIQFIEYTKTMRVGTSMVDESYTITRVGELSKLLLGCRRKKKSIFLEDKVNNIIQTKVIKYGKALKKNKYLPNMGIILYGPPGNGKSLVLSLVRNSSKLPYHAVTAGEILGHKIPLPNLFQDHMIYGFDDIDISFFDREGKNSAEASYLLNFMDGIDKKSNIFILTTNEDVGAIHAAFLRPGRFSHVVKLDKPNNKLRTDYIKSWELNIPVDELVSKTDGWSFAEIGFIRTCLELQKFNNESLNLETALNEFKERKVEETKYMGFRKT